jgi:hypothetical protein
MDADGIGVVFSVGICISKRIAIYSATKTLHPPLDFVIGV